LQLAEALEAGQNHRSGWGRRESKPTSRRHPTQGHKRLGGLDGEVSFDAGKVDHERPAKLG
jgi:hypothetical protein